MKTYYPPIVLQFPGERAGRRRSESRYANGAIDDELAPDRSAELVRFGGAEEQDFCPNGRGDSDVRISIDDLADRLAMLGDVRARVSLIKRDLARLVFYVHGSSQ